jgi:hypothetical protein
MHVYLPGRGARAQALIHGLNRHYYSIGISYRKNALEQKMLLNLHRTGWTGGLALTNYDAHEHANQQAVAVRPHACRGQGRPLACP